ncbi:MAG: hypothetical protein K2X45_13385 [Phreatobacter sp.]|nr:hypothetical protein [Phreatobacter sp.]
MSWDTPLERPLLLKSPSQTLTTLREAADFLLQRFANGRSAMLAGAIEDLMKAAEDPQPSKIRAASRQLGRLLDEERILAVPPDRFDDGAETASDIERRIRRMFAPLRSPSAR